MVPWWVPVGIIVLIGVGLVLYFSPSYTPKVYVTSAGPYNLPQTTTLLKQTDASGVLDPASMTFQAFIYLNPLQRTGAHVDCGTRSNQPSCADGTFQPCKCDPTNGCGNCAHAAFMNVFNLMGVTGLEIMPVPDASRQGEVKAQLVIKTETMGKGQGTGATHDYYIETIPLPFIKFQKWTMITVAREGRRFDIYYNGTLMLSQKTMNMPALAPLATNMNGITCGGSGLIGQLANATLYGERRTTHEVESDYARLADTRGNPYLYEESTLALTLANPDYSGASISGIVPTFGSSLFSGLPSWKNFSISACFLTGNCFTAPAVTPPNGLKQWNTSYA